MTYSDIKSSFWMLLGGASAENPYISTSQLLLWANMAVRDLVMDSKCLERRQQMVATASTQTYDMPSDCAVLLRVGHDGDKLWPITKTELMENTYRWDQDTGTPRMWYADQLNDQFGLYPIPSVSSTVSNSDSMFGFKVAPTAHGFLVDTAYGDRLDAPHGFLIEEITANEIEVYYYARPPEIDSDDDEPELPPWAHPFVVFYMLSRALKQHSPMQDMARSAYWQVMYNDGKQRLQRRSFGKLPKEWVFKSRAWGGRPRISRLPDVIEVS